jgi:MYXO-CTERM domain-containing protein
MILGADVLRGGQAQPGDTPPPGMFNFVLTRLHARYAKGAISEDLVFKAAPPISGGREVYVSSLLGKLLGKPSLEKGAQPASMNNFQGRYAVRHQWTGPIACASPVRGVWGGPPGNQQIAAPVPATDLAFVPRGKVQLARMVRRDVPEIGVVALPKGARVDPDPVEPAKPGKEKPEGKGCAASGGAGAGAALLLGIALLAVRRRRR